MFVRYFPFKKASWSLISSEALHSSQKAGPLLSIFPFRDEEPAPERSTGGRTEASISSSLEARQELLS